MRSSAVRWTTPRARRRAPADHGRGPRLAGRADGMPARCSVIQSSASDGEVPPAREPRARSSGSTRWSAWSCCLDLERRQGARVGARGYSAVIFTARPLVDAVLGRAGERRSRHRRRNGDLAWDTLLGHARPIRRYVDGLSRSKTITAVAVLRRAQDLRAGRPHRAGLPRARAGAGLPKPTARSSSARTTRPISTACSSSLQSSAGCCAALDGRFVAPGPSGAPTRGRADVLPTGRNFYSVDVRAVPTPAAWSWARSADLLVERYFQEHGEWPNAIALTVWGTSNMRTGGDDIAQALALIGARPVWEGASGRVTGIEVLPLSMLRPAARRRDAAHLRLLPRRLPGADRAVRRGGAGGRRARRAGGRQSDRRAHPRRRAALARRAARPRQARTARVLPRLRLQARRLRRRPAGTDRRGHLGGATATSRAPSWTGAATPMARAPRARPHAAVRAPARRGRRRGAEPGQPRARSARLRRLLPVRGRARRRGASTLAGAQPARLPQRPFAPRAAAHPHARGGDRRASCAAAPSIRSGSPA